MFPGMFMRKQRQGGGLEAAEGIRCDVRRLGRRHPCRPLPPPLLLHRQGRTQARFLGGSGASTTFSH
ncbi:hypothetical protein MLD38_013827 [Melastoma candidum]|uniref:Uncharacterized protein n=1 Tax=Melastoma candidum TaxID=119954 RepID=A0ACB9RJA0_9MYRT|nr:hypothetical protein MLD38_013827 [Melastoma candidum]